MKHGSLFSGIGGFDLAAQWMGWENVFHCEWNPFGQKVLKYYWPDAISYDDITKTDFTIHRGKIDILTGGFPCQPYSTAGKRKGKEDDRHLWPEMLRAIREIQPRWVVCENVRGLTNWNGGLVFDEVQADLEAEGYEVTPYLLPACAVNAPHRRDRIWFIAYSGSTGATESTIGINKSRELLQEAKWEKDKLINKSARSIGTTPDPDSIQRREGRMYPAESETTERHIGSCSTWQGGGDWQDFPTQSPVCGRDDGLSNRLDRITFSKWRNESIKAYGNAIVPQVAYQIFKSKSQYEILNLTLSD
jgi:DNA (cytosine-5)-methyltransferase 1